MLKTSQKLLIYSLFNKNEFGMYLKQTITNYDILGWQLSFVIEIQNYINKTF